MKSQKTGVRSQESGPHASRIAPRAPVLHSFSDGGFTLIELLVVIAVIAILAAMIIPITGAVNKTKIRSKAKGELAQIETAIESYHAKHGIYPPDNAGNPYVNQ